MILCEYPSFLVLWCENDCNDAFDAFFIMSTLQSMCNFSALLSVNKPKICFRGPKMNDKMWHKQVYLASNSFVFQFVFEKWDILGHFQTFEFWRILWYQVSDFVQQGGLWFLYFDSNFRIFGQVIGWFFVSEKTEASNNAVAIRVQLLVTLSHLSLIVSYLIVLSHKFGPLLCNISDGWILNVLHK